MPMSGVKKPKMCDNADIGCKLVAHIGIYCGPCKKGKMPNELVRPNLKKWRWSRKYRQCGLCFSTLNKYKANGLCVDCYSEKKADKLKKSRQTVHKIQ